MQKIDFKKHKYDTDLIIGTFGLKRNTKCEILARLIDATGSIDPFFIPYLDKHRLRLDSEGDYWNEEELKMHFLSHIFFLADLDEPDKVKLFYERLLKEEVEGQDIYVKCDCMVASQFGINTPVAPYFFL